MFSHSGHVGSSWVEQPPDLPVRVTLLGPSACGGALVASWPSGARSPFSSSGCSCGARARSKRCSPTLASLERTPLLATRRRRCRIASCASTSRRSRATRGAERADREADERVARGDAGRREHAHRRDRPGEAEGDGGVRERGWARRAPGRVESPTREFVELVVARVGAGCLWTGTTATACALCSYRAACRCSCRGPSGARRAGEARHQELRGHGAAAGPTTRWSDARRRLILGTVPRIRAQNRPENDESRVARFAPNHPGSFYFAEERT